MYFSPFAKKKVGLSLIKIPKLFKTSALNERCWMSQSSQCLGSVVPLAMYQDQSWDQIFLRLLLKHFMIQNLFKMLLVSIWKMIPAQLELEEYQIALKISILKFVKYQDFFLRPLQNFFVTNTATFLRPKFSRLIPRLFFETKYFRDWYLDFFRDQVFLRPVLKVFLRLKFFETDTETFLRPNFSRLIPRLLQKLKSKMAA